MGSIPATAINQETDFFTLEFNAADTMVAGRTNCNRFFGRYELKGKKLEFENMGMTRMACPDMQYEDAFVKMLDDVDRFEIKGSELTFSTTTSRWPYSRPSKKSLRRSSFAARQLLRHPSPEGLPFFLVLCGGTARSAGCAEYVADGESKKNGGRKKVTQLSFVGRIRLSESILPSHMIRLHWQECGQMD